MPYCRRRRARVANASAMAPSAARLTGLAVPEGVRAALTLQPDSSSPGAAAAGGEPTGGGALHPAIGAWEQPAVGEHASVVQGSLSLHEEHAVQASGVPPSENESAGHTVQTGGLLGVHAAAMKVPAAHAVHALHL